MGGMASFLFSDGALVNPNMAYGDLIGAVDADVFLGGLAGLRSAVVQLDATGEDAAVQTFLDALHMSPEIYRRLSSEKQEAYRRVIAMAIHKNHALFVRALLSVAHGTSRFARDASAVVSVLKKRPATTLTWDEVRKMGTVTLPVKYYPPKGDSSAEENEWDYFKQIHYNGVSVYDLVHLGVETITLAPDLKVNGHNADGAFLGRFRNVSISYSGSDGKMNPFFSRLGTLAHETYHALQYKAKASGLGDQTLLFNERGAYFFGAYVLEEYLKLRLASSPLISKEEIANVLGLIAIFRVKGFVANTIIKSVSPDFDKADRRIEIPLTEQQKIIEMAKQKTDGFSTLQTDPANVLSERIAEDERNGVESIRNPMFDEMCRVEKELGIISKDFVPHPDEWQGLDVLDQLRMDLLSDYTMGGLPLEVLPLRGK